MFNIEKLTINYLESPVGIVKPPQFGWILESDRKNVLQESYRLQLGRDHKFKEIIYDSDDVKSAESAHVRIDEIELETASKYYVRVKVKNNYEEESGWSKTGSFLTGMIHPSEWKGEFISAEDEDSGNESKGSYLRTEIVISKKVKEAYAYTTALGVYHFFINGKKVGRDEMAPGWTAYQKRLLYQTYEITEYLQQENNVLGAMIGPGWYKGTVSFRGVRNHYGAQTAFYAHIYIKYEDGSTECVATDGTWKHKESPVVFSEIYDGERYDARLEIPDWNLPGLEDRGWSFVKIVNYEKRILVPQEGAAVREMETIPVKAVITTPKGEIVLDFGQNMTGWVKFRVAAKRNAKVCLRFFEVLDHDGNVYVANLRMAKQQIVYISKGEGEVYYHPYFSFQGFQYIQVLEYPGELHPEDFIAHVVHSDMEETGTFSCSETLVNQLQHNIVWGMKGNFLDVPTDCPQRDERLGWTGDAQVFAGTAMYLMQTYTFFSKWLKDLAAEQREDGAVPFTAPHVLERVQPWEEQGNPKFAAAAWADAAVIVPWNMYLTYGDLEIIYQQYDSMRGWIEFMRARAKDGIWEYHTQFGDHLSLDPDGENGEKATPPELVCCAFYAYSSRLFAKMAKAIGRTEDHAQYSKLSEEVKESFVKHFYKKDGSMKVQTQTAHVLALYFELVPDIYRKQTIQSLVALLRRAGGHLSTGFVGTPYICHVLSRYGYVKEAYELLLKDDFPSWLYQVKKGASTIWEHWDGIKPDGTMWDAKMNSFNHYAYGAIGSWLYREAAGINPDETKPGYKNCIIRPLVGGGLTHASASYRSVYGTIKSSWRKSDSHIRLKVEIPVNATAEFIIEQASSIPNAEGLPFHQTEKGYHCMTGSGTYIIDYLLCETYNGGT